MSDVPKVDVLVQAGAITIVSDMPIDVHVESSITVDTGSRIRVLPGTSLVVRLETVEMEGEEDNG